MKWFIAFFSAQALAAALLVGLTKDNLGDDFYSYELIGETEIKSLDIVAVLQLQLSLSAPVIVVVFLLISVFGRRTKPEAK